MGGEEEGKEVRRENIKKTECTEFKSNGEQAFKSVS